MKWVPNFLSSLRIVVAVVFPLAAGRYRLPLVTVAVLTEYFDGALARQFKWESLLGQILDPIADKLFALSVGVTLVVGHLISWPTLIFISFRDISVGTAFVYFLATSREYHRLSDFRPNLPGKLTTVFQYLVFFDILAFENPSVWLIAVTGCLNVASAILYFRSFAVRSLEKTF
jgi:cardiolipin synthase (CMP-forming)